MPPLGGAINNRFERFTSFKPPALPEVGDLENRVAERTAELSEANARLQRQISERKRAEAALRESTERYEHLFNGAEVSILEEDFSDVVRALQALKASGITDLRDYLRQNQTVAWELAKMVRIKDVNPATLRMFSASSSQEFLESIDRILGPVSIDVCIDELCAIWAGKSVFRAECVQHTLDGRDLSVILSMPIPDSEEGFCRIPVSLTDITDRKRAAQEMQHMRAYLKNIIDSMPSALVGVDAEGCITELNRRAEQLTGISRKQAQGHTFGDIFPQLKAELKQVQRAIQQRQPTKTERLMNTIDGEIRYTDVMVYPLIANGVMGAVIRLDDVTARVRIEEMMVQTEKMLSVGGLAAGMAHEINNPLGVILQSSQNILRRLSPELPKNCEVAQDQGVDLVQVRKYLDARGILNFLEGIQEAGTRASKIVADMLAFSRRSESRFVPTDPGELLDTGVRLCASDYDLEKKYDFKQIEIEREYDPALREVPCDKTAIEQVILNLLKNAAQAMAGHSSPHQPPRIILRTSKEAEYARIEVIDNGPGMDEKTRKRILEPFFTTKEVGMGTGLGLSVAYFIITEQHKGTLTVESAPGQGARFIIRLPFKALW